MMKYSKREIFEMLEKANENQVLYMYHDIQTAKKCRFEISSYDDTEDRIHFALEQKLRKCINIIKQGYLNIGLNDITSNRNIYVQYDSIAQYFDIFEEYYMVKAGN